MTTPKRGAREGSLEERATRAFEEYFGIPFEERFRASLADAREWTESVAALHKRASAAMEQARSVAREARALAKEAASLNYDGMGPIDQTRRLWTDWLSVVPAYDGAISLAEWLRRSTTFGALAKTPWPTSPWGLWREALDKWWRRENLFPIGDDAPPRLHMALQHFAGFADAQPKRAETAERATKRITKLIRDWRRYEADRRGDYAEELSSAIGAVWSESIDTEKAPRRSPVLTREHEATQGLFVLNDPPTDTDELTVAELSVAAQVDRRSVRKALRGEVVRGMAGARIRRALRDRARQSVGDTQPPPSAA